MSNFDLEDEFIARTQKNLKAIECLKQKGGEVYEVTQLLNSMLGLLIFPKEKLYKKIQPKNWDMMVKEGWPLPSGDNAHVSNLKQLVRNMRNAVAHFNIELVNDGNEITGIRFGSFSKPDSHREGPHWTGMYDIASLREFVNKLSEHLQSSSKR
ncbi:MAG TPA: HEPN family nuclease [Anaerolineaceae bacterium]|jgi:hypothetical protein|nr:hypothetical protein [Anaerolineaceae bacterium]HOV30337.1 HEPN family nuclease [Anaerolineaceae bacterium]